MKIRSAPLFGTGTGLQTKEKGATRFLSHPLARDPNKNYNDPDPKNFSAGDRSISEAKMIETCSLITIKTEAIQFSSCGKQTF